MIRRTLAFALFAGGALAGCQDGDRAVAPAAAQPGSYASHFNKPGQRYDEHARAVDRDDYLVDNNGRRIGGKGHWTSGARDDVLPAGTEVNASGRPTHTPPSTPIAP